jgi:hypothetical protein
VNLVLINDRLVAAQIQKNISLERLDSGSPLALRTATARRISDSEAYRTRSMRINLNVKAIGMNQPLSQSRTLVKHSFMSNEGPSIHGEMTARPQPNEGPAITATLPWYSKTLASLTVYGELFAARTPGEFAIVHTRLQQEWIFNGGFVSLFTILLLNSHLIRSSMSSS